MTIKDKSLDIVAKSNKRLDKLKQEEVKAFGEIKKLNTDLMKWEEKRNLMYDGEISISELSKINDKMKKINNQIMEQKELVKMLRESREQLKERYALEIGPVQKELFAEYLEQLKSIGIEVQDKLDQVTLTQVCMYDLQSEYSSLISELNSITETNFSYSLPVVEVSHEATMNGFRQIPIGHIADIKKDLKHYNKVYGRYGRLRD